MNEWKASCLNGKVPLSWPKFTFYVDIICYITTVVLLVQKTDILHVYSLQYKNLVHKSRNCNPFSCFYYCFGWYLPFLVKLEIFRLCIVKYCNLLRQFWYLKKQYGSLKSPWFFSAALETLGFPCLRNLAGGRVKASRGTEVRCAGYGQRAESRIHRRGRAVWYGAGYVW